MRSTQIEFWVLLHKMELLLNKSRGLHESNLYSHHTPHLNRKKLSTNSSWDFEHVFETMDDYWVGPDENFFPESTPTRWRCDHFSKKWSKSKSDTTLSLKKTFSHLLPVFCSCHERFLFWPRQERCYLILDIQIYIPSRGIFWSHLVRKK